MSAERFDVIVAGAGTAGSIAAIAAAQTGARTCLIESSGYVGGTTYALGNVVTFHNNQMQQVIRGLPQRVVDRLVLARGVVGKGHLPNPGGMGGTVTLMDSSVLNAVLLEMMQEAGVEVKLHTLVTGVRIEGNRLTAIEITSKGGVRALAASTFVDSSGDADIAVRSGAACETDAPGRGLSATSVYRVCHVDHKALVQDLRNNPHKVILLEDPYLRDERGLTAEGVMRDQVRSIYDLPYIYLTNLVRDYISKSEWARWDITGTEKHQWGALKPFGSRVHLSASPASPDLLYVNTTNVHFDALNPDEVSRAEFEAQRQVKLSLDVLRRYVPGFGDAVLVGSMPKISVRASRRVIGDYQLTRDDVTLNARFPDAIAKGCYPMSVQSETQPNVRLHLYVRNGSDFDIPYRCLLPKGVEGLLVAGRCISATREASGSARTGAQCMAYGHAAGVAAALSAKEQITPRALGAGVVRQTLIAQQAII